MGEKGKHPWTHDREETKHNLSKILSKKFNLHYARVCGDKLIIFIPMFMVFVQAEHFKNIQERGINQECILQIQDSGNVL